MTPTTEISEGKWVNVRAGNLWECPPYRLVVSCDKDLGEVWIAYRQGRHKPIATHPRLDTAMHLCYLDRVKRHETAVERGLKYPGKGRPTRYPKDYRLNIEVHKAGWQKLEKMARKHKASKADTLCGILDSLRGDEDLKLPEPKLPD